MVEGLCVVVWRGNKWGGQGVALGSFSSIASMPCTWFFHGREMGVGCELLGFENFTGTHEPFATCKQFS